MRPFDTEELAHNFEAVEVRLKNWLQARFAGVDHDDVFQEAVLAAWSNLDHYDVNRSFEAWFWTIAKRKAIEASRRKKARREVSSHDHEFRDPAVSFDTLRELASAEAVQEVQDAIASLPENYGQVINLRLKGWSYERIRQELRRTEGSIRGLISRAKVRVQRTLQQKAATETHAGPPDPVTLAGMLANDFDLCRTRDYSAVFDESFARFDASITTGKYYFVVLLERVGDVSFPIDIDLLAPEYCDYNIAGILELPFSENFRDPRPLWTAFTLAQDSYADFHHSSRMRRRRNALELDEEHADCMKYCGPLRAVLGADYDFVVIPISFRRSLLVIRRLSELPKGWDGKKLTN